MGGVFGPDANDDSAQGIIRDQYNPHPHILRIDRGLGTLTHPNGKIVKGFFRAMVVREGRPVSTVRNLKPRLLPRAPLDMEGRGKGRNSGASTSESPRKQFAVLPPNMSPGID